ncbi:MAG: Yip1 family protein [Elusimicrobiota bacterium]
MPDQRIVDYLRQNMGSYPIESLKTALAGNGFPPEAIEEAVRAVMAQNVPPPPAAAPIGPGREADVGGFIDFKPGKLIANAVFMAQQPTLFFSRINPNGGFGPPLVVIILWALISAPLSAFTVYAKTQSVPFTIAAATGGLFMLPIVAIIMSFIGAAIFHVLCKVLGGGVSYNGSFGAFAAMAALMPISSLLGLIPYAGAIIPQLCGLYLAVHAAAGLHRVDKKKAWLVFGALTVFWLLLSISAAIAAQRLKSSLGNFQGQISTQQSSSFGGPPAVIGTQQQQQPMNPQQAIQAASAMMQALGDEQANNDFQQAMHQAQTNPMGVIQEMQRYQKMQHPPNETLLLLDSRTSSLLVKEWPKMSGPIRQSLVETLPNIPKADRAGTVKEMIEATRGVNEMLGQSMEMLNQVMGQQQQQQGGNPR